MRTCSSGGTSESLVTPCMYAKVMLKDRKSTRLNSSHLVISYAVFCLKKKKKNIIRSQEGSRNRRILKAKQTGYNIQVCIKSNINTIRHNVLSSVVRSSHLNAVTKLS